MKVKKITIENYKNIKSIDANVQGKSVYITGKNGQGKSSFIQAVFSTLSSENSPIKAIKEGEEKARVTLTIGDATKDIIVEKVFTEASPNGRLIVRSPEGAIFPKPAQFLEQLIGSVSFDMERFLLLKNEKEMVNFLKEFLKIDTDTLDESYKEAYANRTNVNRILKEKTEQLKAYEDVIDVEVPSIEEIQKQAFDLDAQSQKVNDLKQRKIKGEGMIAHCQVDIVNIEKDIEELQKKLDLAKQLHLTKKEEHVQLQKSMEHVLSIIQQEEEILAAMPNPSAQLEEINKLQIEKNKFIQKQELLNEYEVVSKSAIDADTLVKNLEQQRNNIFKGKGIAGIQITEDGILYNNLPLSRNQINTAGLSELAVDIILAADPKLKAVKFDASTMDKETYHRVLSKIEAAGLQCFVEEVDKEGGELRIEVIENI